MGSRAENRGDGSSWSQSQRDDGAVRAICLQQTLFILCLILCEITVTADIRLLLQAVWESSDHQHGVRWRPAAPPAVWHDPAAEASEVAVFQTTPLRVSGLPHHGRLRLPLLRRGHQPWRQGPWEGDVREGVVGQDVVKEGIVGQGVIEEGIIRGVKEGIVREGIVRKGVRELIKDDIVREGVVKKVVKTVLSEKALSRKVSGKLSKTVLSEKALSRKVSEKFSETVLSKKVSRKVMQKKALSSKRRYCVRRFCMRRFYQGRYYQWVSKLVGALNPVSHNRLKILSGWKQTSSYLLAILHTRH